MPMPTEDRVSRLIAALLDERGYDLEGVRVTSAGKRSTVQVMVDRDEGVDLDAIAELSTAVSTALDAADDFGEHPYTLEVTTPGVDRPLTAPRHWRRARGRRVRLLLGGEPLVGRVGAVHDDTVELVIAGKTGPTVQTISLAEVTKAIVQVEFAPPDPRELALAGGVSRGRPAPADPGSNPTVDTAGVNEE
jgi:ribosome maturation factor RimP